ncbi:hypothetical protein I4F81_009776 [Pyropia yezoensis]|uniref:Uncharacterized protein n=1 Tax=Pyropia yezoensis TaxID=2788 RepID=A0ACC3CAT5_PYRYE|nr:hypothetical protein I4F81_009776 [Neopyropia yezoensis]
MKAVTYTTYGVATDVLTLSTDVPEPTLPAPGDSSPPSVLLRVHAVALNPVDWKRISGALRPFFSGPSAAAPLVPCMDVAGVVTATSSSTPAFPVGTRVFGCIPGGAMAEVAVAPEAVLAAIPEGFSFVEAAAVPLACLTVLHGAGGTGSFALQLAKRVFGIPRVVTTVSAAKAEVATSLGADECIDYRTSTIGAALRGDARVVAALDLVGDIPAAVGGVVPGGAVVGIAGPFQASQMGPWCPNGVPFRGEELAEVAGWMREGKVKALVDSVHEGLEAHAAAFGVLMGGHAAGKVVVRVVPEEG